MRLLRFAFLNVLVFGLILTIVSLFFPSHIRVSKALDINAPKDSVWTMLHHPENWKKWYPGADSAALYYENGVVKGIATAQNQALVIGSETDSSIVLYQIDTRKRNAVSGWNIYPSSNPNTITLQWYMDFHLKWYPWEKYSSILLEKRYAPTMERGLTKLKGILEKK